MLLSNRLLLYHNLGLESGPNFRWQYIYPENDNYSIYLAFFETTDNIPDIPTMLNMSEKNILDNFTKFIRSYQNEAEAKAFVDGMMHIIRNPLAPPDLGFIHTIINSLENN